MKPDQGSTPFSNSQKKPKSLKNKEPVDPVDFRKLKELLPEKAGGFSRKESNGEKSGMGGFNISRAEGKYEKEGESFIDVEILDTGGIGGFALAGLAAWTIAKVDKETETGYEKSTTIEGYKAFEQYDNQSKDGQLHLLVGDRYILNVSGNNVSMDQMKALLTDLSLDKLADLK